MLARNEVLVLASLPSWSPDVSLEVARLVMGKSNETLLWSACVWSNIVCIGTVEGQTMRVGESGADNSLQQPTLV